MTAILIQGGRVIDPARGFDAAADVLVADGVVREIATRPGAIDVPAGAARVDAEGCLVTPGLIDVHVHFREPGDDHEETIATGAASALNGGFTTVCCMPNTTPPLDTPDMVRLVHERGERAAGPRVFAVGCGTRGRAGVEVADIAGMAGAGAVAFSDDGDCIADDAVMAAVMQAVRAVDGCFMQHCQDPAMTEGAAMNAGPVAEALGVIGWPVEAEERIIERDLDLVRATGCRYHPQHLSSGGSADLIRRARAEGLPATAEVSPHHLLLTEEACRGGDTNAKMNPPLRTAADVERLKEAVADGTITILATDHAPHPEARKRTGFAEAAFGIVGLDCALPLYARALVEDGVIGWPRLVAMMTSEPACLVGLDGHGLGSLAPGGPADVTVIDPDLAWTVDASAFATTGRNCPFDGWDVRSRAVATIVAGRLREREATGRVRV
jgi:dihydroorotase